MTKTYTDNNGNTYTEDQTYTATGLQSCSRHKNSTYGTKYTNTFRDYCPHCGKTGVLTNKHKYSARYEGQVTCGNCDADYCIACGYEKVNGSKYHLTILKEYTAPTTPTKKMLTDGKQVYITMDYDIDRGGSKDSRFMNNVINVLKNNGINVIGSKHGPNSWTSYIRNHTSASNTIVLGIVNGSDAGVIAEATSNFGYWKSKGAEIGLPKGIDQSFHGKNGFLTNNRGNALVLAFTERSKDFYHEDGVDYKYLERAHDMDYGPNASQFKGINSPLALLKEYGINVIWAAGHNSDGTGDSAYNRDGGTKTGELFVKWAKSITDSEIMSVTPTTTDDTTNTDTSDTNSTDTILEVVQEKTLTKQVIENIYTAPNTRSIIDKATTDKNGAFSTKMIPAIRGKYQVNYYFSGDKDYADSSKTVTIDFQSGKYFQEQLLQRTTTNTYSDGSTTTTVEGSKGSEQYTRTETTTITYEKGVEKTRNTKESYSDIYMKQATTTTTTTGTSTTTTTTTTTTPTTPGTTTTPGGAKNPFYAKVPLLAGGKPDVAKFTSSQYTFEWADENATYTLTKEQYREVMIRDAKTMQLKNMMMSKYVMFRTQDKPTTYHILRREKWNCIEKQLNYILVYANPDNPSEAANDLRNTKNYPETLTVNLGGTNTVAGKSWNLKDVIYNFWFVLDRQNDLSTSTGTCGATSASMISQYLHDFVSEGKMRSTIGRNSPGGDLVMSALEKNSHIKRSKSNLNSNGIKDSTDIKTYLEKGYPIFFHCDNHYSDFMDLSASKNSACVFNPATNYSIDQGWQEVSYCASCVTYFMVYCEPDWSISDSEATQLKNLFESLGGGWKKPGNTNEYQYTSRGTPIVWDKHP